LRSSILANKHKLGIFATHMHIASYWHFSWKLNCENFCICFKLDQHKRQHLINLINLLLLFEPDMPPSTPLAHPVYILTFKCITNHSVLLVNHIEYSTMTKKKTNICRHKTLTIPKYRYKNFNECEPQLEYRKKLKKIINDFKTRNVATYYTKYEKVLVHERKIRENIISGLLFFTFLFPLDSLSLFGRYSK
jgi:hypothetical protein